MFLFELKAWKDWFDADAPEEAPIPDGYGTALDTFHKFLLVRSWCPDRTIPMAKIFIAESMGKEVSCNVNELFLFILLLLYLTILIDMRFT